MPGPTTSPRAPRGAVAMVERRERRRPAWLLWLLALLAIIAIVALLIGLLGGDDETSTSKSGGSATPAGLTSGGQSLQGANLKSSIGDDASGTGVVVQSVNKAEGFWVGAGKADRVYVEFGGRAGENESGYRPDSAGQKVDLEGPVRAAPSDPQRTLKLSAADARQVKQTGAYINADEVAPAG